MVNTRESDSQAFEKLVKIVGIENVILDRNELEYFSQDYFKRANLALAVIRPANAKELASCVAVSTGTGLAVYPRGGGYSYTSGYLTTKPGVVVDVTRMDKILRINTDDMYVTVEPGCTWAALDAALAKEFVRTPFFGPYSGLHATVGGSISQGTISLGSGKYGVSSESVLDLDIVTADGGTLTTGVAGQPNHKPFFRNYGPDITGLFCSDCGALGVKASITLKLIRRPSYFLGLAFGFESFSDMASAATAVAKEGVAADNIGMPAAYALASTEKSSLGDDLKVLWKVASTGASVIDGLVRAARIAVSGRRFLKNVDQTFNVVVEGSSRRDINLQAAIVRRAVGKLGVEIANTVPMAMRADPFIDHDTLSPTGQRQLPPSTIVPFSVIVPLVEELDSAIDSLVTQMTSFGMSVTPVIATIGTNACLVEPVIAWDEAPDEFHRRNSSAQVLKLASAHKESQEARELAATVRQRFIDIAFRHGGVHLQIGKVYPFLAERDELTIGLLKSIKAQVDPKGLMNPGALGLAT